MNDLNEITRQLKREPDEAMLHRVRAGVRARDSEPASPWEILAGWLRPAGIAAGAIIVLTVAMFTWTQDPITPGALADSVLIQWEAQIVGQ